MNMRRKLLRLVLAACLSGALLPLPLLAGEASGPAAEFSLPARGGPPVALSALRGQVVLVNFWATWCGPCRKEMPLLEQIHRKYAPLGFTLLGINVEEDTTHMEAFLGDVPVTFPVLLDPANHVSKLYDVAAMPSTVIIDRKGQVRYIHQGWQPGDESRYQDVIRQLIRERT
jgi:peroxiredoxin